MTTIYKSEKEEERIYNLINEDSSEDVTSQTLLRVAGIIRCVEGLKECESEDILKYKDQDELENEAKDIALYTYYNGYLKYEIDYYQTIENIIYAIKDHQIEPNDIFRSTSNNWKDALLPEDGGEQDFSILHDSYESASQMAERLRKENGYGKNDIKNKNFDLRD